MVTGGERRTVIAKESSSVQTLFVLQFCANLEQTLDGSVEFLCFAG